MPEPFTGPSSRPILPLIAILPLIGTLFEGILHKQIQKYFHGFCLNTDFQHADRVGHSTATVLTSLTGCWLQLIDMKHVVGTVFLDFSATLDIIDHDLLIRKLRANGFRNSAVELMRRYLSNRQQCVMCNGSISYVTALECGIPQGSCLGPPLLYFHK